VAAFKNSVLYFSICSFCLIVSIRIDLSDGISELLPKKDENKNHIITKNDNDKTAIKDQNFALPNFLFLFFNLNAI
jgi:hypothetical protein